MVRSGAEGMMALISCSIDGAIHFVEGGSGGWWPKALRRKMDSDETSVVRFIEAILVRLLTLCSVPYSAISSGC